jgi:hypothetical protein
MDYTDIIEEIVQPKVIDNVVVAKMDKLNSLFTKNTDIKSGALITDPNCIGETSAGGAFTRADANPSSMTQTFASPYWNKVYYHEAAKVRREDIDEAREGSPLVALLTDAATKATKQLMGLVFSGCITQIKSDVDSAANYSDAGTTRVTALQSYEEATDATITLAYMRGATNAIGLKDEIDWNEYVWLIEQTVLNSGHPLMAATGSWIQNDPTKPGQYPIGPGGVASGYLPVGSFDGVSVDTTYGMTVGDLFLLNRGDVQIQKHKDLELELVFVDEYAYKMVARIGVNAWVRRPAFQGKLTSKD